MRLLYLYLIVIFSVLTGTVESQTSSRSKKQQYDLQVTSILNRYCDSIHLKALIETKALSRKGILIRGSVGSVPFEMYSVVESKWYYKQIFAYGDVVCYGSDGQNHWVQDTKGVSVLSNEERLDLEILLDFQLPNQLTKIFSSMVIKTTSNPKHNDNPTIIASTADGLTRELEFDFKTGLLVRSGDIYFSDYRAVNGFKIPYRIFIGDYNKNILQLKIEIKGCEVDEHVSDDLFRQPVCPLLFQKSQLYTLRKQVKVSNEAMNACVGQYKSLDDTNQVYNISIYQNHLMVCGTGFPKTEIKPESELDYFIRFWNLEFHFVKDDSSRVVMLEIGSDRWQKAKKIK